MKAVVIEQFGGPEVLQYKEVPTPQPGHQEVLIKVEKTSVNYADIKNRTGKKAKGDFPIILGLDLVGTIDQLGEGVTDLTVGQRVIAFPKTGSYAEYAVASEQLTFPIPDEISLDVAAASPIVAFLSYKLLKDVGRIEAGETVLVHSAAGGVGTTAVQMAKLLGASHVFGTVGSREKFRVAYEAGADHVFTYDDFSDNILELTDGMGVDIILDSMSGKVSEASMSCLAEYGRLVHFGNSSSEVGHFKTNELHNSCRSVLGFSLGNTRKKRPELLKEAAEHVIPFLARGDLDIVIGAEFPLHEVAEAHRLIEQRQHTGKILLTV
ncbi:zinc-binding dehydrogenase [Ornithinibacillus sp. BX22]|uniref:Zinc-binding dehydrogenase n=1 Tax=Ornithinibacillus hominis TaxID=2763055 RepID=A0A923RHB7_9BACI|nr:zinc-binding dehydrogenase [Ornithinibacillus hominis]MBC5636456.1 zinc-binding dehydrogenase [Ornithinibacillus hominis]